jgi:Sec-independent protein translocase protein TatA
MDKILEIRMNELLIVFPDGDFVLGPERLVRVASEAGKLISNVKANLSS